MERLDMGMTSAEFRAALAELGLSQAQLSRTLGVHPMTVMRWANGHLVVPRYVAAYLALKMALGVDRKPSCR